MVKLSDLQIGDENLGHELNHLDRMPKKANLLLFPGS